MRVLPHDFPNWKLVYYYVSTSRDANLWSKIHGALLTPTRRRAGREHDTPSAGRIDSSTVKAPEGNDRGFDGGKKIQGRKRHKAVDTLGLLPSVVVTAGSVDDARTAPAVVCQPGPAKYPRMELLWADTKYHNLNDWVRNTYKGPIRIDVTKRTDAGKGFKPIRWRRVVARTNGWVKRSRRNALDDEHNTSSSEAMIRITTTRIMLDRRTHPKPESPFRYPKKPKTSS